MNNLYKSLTKKHKLSLDDPIVFIIDDDKEVLQALTWLLNSINLNVICYESAVDFCKEYNPQQCGCIITDVRMPIMSGLQLFDHLFETDNLLPIIFLTGHGDIPMAVQMIKAGAIDFISKPFNEQYLLEQIQKAINLSIQRRKEVEDKKSLNSLSKREQQVIQLVVNGKLNKQIATDLHISNSTVEFHRSRAMKKLGAKNIADLITIYLKANKNDILD